MKEVIVDDKNLGIINYGNIDTIEEIEEVLENIQEDENDEKIYDTNECNLPGACDFSDDLTSEDASTHTHIHTSDHESTPVKEVIGQIAYDLRDWARQNKSVTHTAIDQLLGLLLKNFPNCGLPKSARTLLGTTYTPKAITIQGGEYMHIGMQFALTSLMNAYIHAGLFVNHINLSLNIDGLPLSKSSTKCLWPILISDDLIKSVQVIGIFYGCGKPTSANEFISMFVKEMKAVVRDGFMYDGKIISVTLSKIICDAPAKSFLLKTKGHTGFSSCSKCTIVGRSISGTVCFPYTESSSRLRTDEDFLQQSDEDYHRGETILLEIPNLGLVSNVTLDYMHLVCLGVVKKLLLLWLHGPLSVRMCKVNIDQISQKLIAYKKTAPREFSRKPRSLAEVKYWKATEFRTFLLYTGPVVLRSVLESEKYLHFLSLHVAISIFTNPKLVAKEHYIKYAEDLIIYFVKKFGILYREQFISHNVHNLLHLAEEVRKYGVLDNFSAFHFESFLGGLKQLIRKAEKPLEQISCRFSEKYMLDRQQFKLQTCKLKQEHFCGPLLPCFIGKPLIQYKSLQTNVIYLNCDFQSDNMVMLKNHDICKVLNIIKLLPDKIYLIVKHYKVINPIYEKPCSSAILFMFIVVEDNRSLSKCLTSKIMYKVWTTQKSRNEYYALPLSHAV